MTDANLMDAVCIHGNVWYECTEVECVVTEKDIQMALTSFDVDYTKHPNDGVVN